MNAIKKAFAEIYEDVGGVLTTNRHFLVKKGIGFCIRTFVVTFGVIFFLAMMTNASSPGSITFWGMLSSSLFLTFLITLGYILYGLGKYLMAD